VLRSQRKLPTEGLPRYLETFGRAGWLGQRPATALRVDYFRRVAPAPPRSSVRVLPAPAFEVGLLITGIMVTTRQEWV
jgi:hypothetical protein